MRKLLTTLTLASGLALSLAPAAALAQYSGTPNGKIYFSSADRTDILRSNADGTVLQPVLSTADPISVPVVSKDGTKIVYSHIAGANVGLWVVNTDGSNNHQITSVSGDHNPIWSPDGTKVYFDNGGDILSANGDGSDGRTTLLTHRLISDVNYNFYEPSVSPNGLKLAVIGVNQNSTLRGDVFTFSIANNADLANVTVNATKDVSGGGLTSSLWVDYSPDGTQLAIANYNFNNTDTTRIDKMAVAGGAYTNVLSSVVDGDVINWYYSEAHWSPVGDKLIAHRNSVQGGDTRHVHGLLDAILQGYRGLRTVSATNADPSSGFTDLSSLGDVGPAWWTVGPAAVVVTPGLPNVGAVK